jgi:hypothetical protein
VLTRTKRHRRLACTSVTAILVLLLSLSGASYAASLSLQARSVTNDSPQDLSKGACNGALRPGETPPPCVPSRFGGLSPTQLRISTRHPGYLFVSAIAGLDNQGTPETHAEVSYAVILDERAVSRGEITISGGQQEQVPIQTLLRVRGGFHTIGLQLSAEYSGYGPGDVIVSPVSLIAVSLP